MRVPLLLALLAAQLPTLQQPSPTAPAAGTSAPAELVQAAEAAKAQQATKERIAALTREADVLKRQSVSMLDQVRRLDVERDLERAREVQARQALSVLEADLASLTSRQATLRSTLEGERPAIAARLRRLQRLGRVGYARIAWNATSARDVGRAARLMNYLAKDDGRRLQAYARTAGELGETEARLTQRREEARSLEAEARVRRAAAEAAYVKKRELLASLENESEQRERWLAELVAARARLDASMTGRAPVPAPTQVLRVPFTTRRRALPWPVEGNITGRFGRQRDARFGTSTVSNGVTIASTIGSAVRALHPGSVVFAGAFTGFGQLVIVDHGQQSYSLYGYLSGLRVQRGAAVEGGAIVGEVGDAPDGKAALYLEVRVDGRPVDPVLWLQQR
ncbi:Septal ring factor [Luteitalea pratensis]|uniref:Septal ring factor n=1 Tax=Luteitalea pratensis TaxID=1855912 RepID=A0A143PM19_LUTPR|nr:peptidoglycan DD-metalloendopeptidase family protein [Luteitalea pratensis]AMY09637.1 Septal ring factor [Luteitalea pratensis]